MRIHYYMATEDAQNHIESVENIKHISFFTPQDKNITSTAEFVTNEGNGETVIIPIANVITVVNKKAEDLLINDVLSVSHAPNRVIYRVSAD